MYKPAKTWRKSIWSKFIAAGFIFQVLIGNIWLVQRFSMKEPPFWLQVSFIYSSGAIIAFGLALGAERYFVSLTRGENGDGDDAEV